MTSFRYLIVELRFSEASAEEVAMALAPPEIESDLGDFFDTCFVWAGNLFLKVARDYKENKTGVKDRNFKGDDKKREEWLTERLREYDQIERVVYNYFYDTPMCGYFRIYRRSHQGNFVEIEEVDYGQGAFYFDLPRDYVMESVDYIQSKYGIHVLSYRDLGYPHSRTWDFEVEQIC